MGDRPRGICFERGIHFGTVTAQFVGQRATSDPGSSLLWDSSALTVAQNACRPTAVPKWIRLTGNMLGATKGFSKSIGSRFRPRMTRLLQRSARLPRDSLFLQSVVFAVSECATALLTRSIAVIDSDASPPQVGEPVHPIAGGVGSIHEPRRAHRVGETQGC